MFRFIKTKKLIATLVLGAVILVGVSAPISPSRAEAQVVEAIGALSGLMGLDLGGGSLIGGVLGNVLGIGGGGGGAVTIVEDLSPSSIARTAANISQTLSLTKQEVKEQVLDPLFWKLGNATIGDMVSSMVEWVNDTGNGNPAFITDLEQYLHDTEDSAATENLESPGFDALCPSIAVEVKTAVKKGYALSRKSKTADAAKNQCSLQKYADNEEDFRKGKEVFTWDKFNALVSDPMVDPIEATNELTALQKERTDEAYNLALAKAVMNNGFLDVEVCESYDSVTSIGRDCKTKTPGSVVQEQLVNSLNLPGLRAAFAGELDESLGTMMSNLFSQAFRGTNGLLGLGGNDQYADTSYGSGEDLSFLAGLRQEASDSIAGTQTAEKIQQLIQTQFDYTAILLEVVTLIDKLDTQIKDARDTYGECFTTELTPTLTSARDTAKTRALQAGQRVEQLTGYYQQLQNATTDAERAKVAISVGTYETQTGSQVQIAVQTAERDRDQVLPDLIDTMQGEIDDNIESCGGEITHDGNNADNVASSTDDGTATTTDDGTNV